MCDIAECSTHVLRKARTPHNCRECGSTIETKERYWYTSGIFNREPFSRKTCWDCQELIDYLLKIPDFDCLDDDLFWELRGRDFTTFDEDIQEEIALVPWLQPKGDYWKLAKYARALQTVQNTYPDFKELPL